MVGIDVMPRSPSSAMSRASVPDSIRSRVMKSYHGLWPSWASRTKGFWVILTIPFRYPVDRLDHPLRGEAELFEQPIAGRRRAEVVETQAFAGFRHPRKPPERRRGFHRYPRSNRRRQHLVSIRRRL